MVVLNYTGEEINAKIVYYGPGLSGKTTNLENLYSHMPVDAKGQMVSMKTRTDRTLFFDFFPLELGEISGYRTRFLLYTVPGQVYYNATRKLVLKGADAVVFVADSAPDKLEENIESLRNLEDNLNEHGLSLDDIPWVIQYNKRDIPDAMPVAELHKHLNLMNVPALEAVALTGFGVYDTFKCIAGILYKKLKERLESGEGFPQSAADGTETTVGATPPGHGGVDVTEAVDSALREVGETATTPVPPHVQPVSTQDQVPPTPPADIPPVPAPPVQVTVHAVSQPETVSQRDVAGTPPPAGANTAPSPTSAEPVSPPSHSDTAESQQSTHAPRAAQPPIPPSPESTADDRPMLEPQPQKSSPDIGRLVELDETPNGFGNDRQETPEFITDPMQRRKPSPPSVEESPEKPPEFRVEESPVITERNPEPEEHEISIPVVISRSQVRKTIPLRLRLEIRVVDD
jgi:signal recognition particle receptor subunit beta